MSRVPFWLTLIIAVVLAALGGRAITAQDTGPEKYTVQVPGGLAFSEFRGYEAWQVISISQDGAVMAAILGNPAMIGAYRAGIPGNGKAFPDGSKMAKIHWNPKKMETFPAATVPGTLHDVDFMVKDRQAVRGQRRMGVGRVQVRRRSRQVRARRHDRHAAARERRQVGVRMPHDREGARLRLHGLRAALNGEQPTT
jgi:Cytochrome P460